MRRQGERSEHSRMGVPHLFVEVLQDDRTRIFGAHREIGSGHPVDEIPFQHGGIPRNDLTPLVGSENGWGSAGMPSILRWLG